MKKLLVPLLLLSASALAQTGNTIHVSQFLSGSPTQTVGAAVGAAAGQCLADTTIPCYLVIDPILAAYPAGVVPSLASNVHLIDWRSGVPWTGAGGGGGGGGAISVVTCGGTNDTAAIQSAFNNAGYIVLQGGCVVTSHLTLQSNTALDATAATITYSPSSADQLLINYAEQHQTPYKTATGLTLTNGSLTVTAGSAQFAATDVGQSIRCSTAADGTLDLMTYVTAFSTSQSITIASAPGVTISGTASCALIARDTNIHVRGGTWKVTGTAVSAAAALPVIAFKSANNLVFRDAAVSGLFQSSAYLVLALDVANFEFTGVNVAASSLHQDGIHICGPARNGRIANISGVSGDDFVAFTARDTNWQANDSSVYGAIANVDVENLQGASNQEHALTIISAPACPVTGIKARHIYGSSDSGGTNKGFNGILISDNLTYLANGGWSGAQGVVDDIDVDDIGGYQRGPLAVSTSNGGSIRISHLSAPIPAISGPMVQVGPSPSTVAVAVNDLSIDGVQFNQLTANTSLLQIPQTSGGPQTTVGQLRVHGVQETTGTSGAFNLASFGTTGGTAGPTLGDVIFDSVQVTYNGNANANGLIDVYPYTTITSMNLAKMHVTHGTGSAAIAEVLAVSNNATITSVSWLNPSLIAPTLTNDLLMLVTSSGTIGNSTIINPQLTNVLGCVGGAPAAAQVSNPILSGVTSSIGSCYPVGAPLGFARTNSTTNDTGTTTFFSVPANQSNVLIRVDCTLGTGNATGTGTANLYVRFSGGSGLMPGSTYQNLANLTLAANAYESASWLFGAASSGGTGFNLTYQFGYTAGTGGSYNAVCVPTRLQ